MQATLIPENRPAHEAFGVRALSHDCANLLADASVRIAAAVAALRRSPQRCELSGGPAPCQAASTWRKVTCQ